MRQLKKRAESWEMWDRMNRRTVGYSRAYHRNFEGYTEYLSKKKNGRTKIERVYTGIYYRAAMSKSERRMQLLKYALAIAAAGSLFIRAAILPVISNYTKYVVMFETVFIFFSAWSVIAYINFVIGGRNMKIRDYKTASGWLKKSSAGGAIAAGLLSVATVLCTVSKRVDIYHEFVCIICFLAAGGLMLGINRMESKVIYEEILGEAIETAGGIEIS